MCSVSKDGGGGRRGVNVECVIMGGGTARGGTDDTGEGGKCMNRKGGAGGSNDEGQVLPRDGFAEISDGQCAAVDGGKGDGEM